MKKTLRFLAVAAAAALAVYAIWRVALAPAPARIVARTATRGLVERTVANTRVGTVDVRRRAKLAPVVGGRVSRLTVREGSRVEAGDVLLEIWNEDAAAEVRLARAQAERAGAALTEAKVRAAHARRDAERQQRLRREGVASEDVVDRAVSGADVAEAALAAAEADLSVAEARIATMEAAFEKTFLRAPFAGVVAEVNAELGEYVIPSPPGIPTPPAVDLIDDSAPFVTAPIDEVDAPDVKPGLPARITLDAHRGLEWKGVVRRIAPYVLDREKQARTVDVEVDFEAESAPALLPGYSANVEIVLESAESALRVPAQAVVAGNRVYVVPAGTNVVEERRIERGLGNWQYVEVKSGLSEGDRVVISPGAEGVTPGAVVEVSSDGKGP